MSKSGRRRSSAVASTSPRRSATGKPGLGCRHRGGHAPAACEDRAARDLVNLVRAQTGPYPDAWCLHEGRRLRVLEASVSADRCGGTNGRVFAREGSGVISGAAAPKPASSRSHTMR